MENSATSKSVLAGYAIGNLRKTDTNRSYFFFFFFFFFFFLLLHRDKSKSRSSACLRLLATPDGRRYESLIRGRLSADAQGRIKADNRYVRSTQFNNDSDLRLQTGSTIRRTRTQGQLTGRFYLLQRVILNITI